MEKIGFPEAIAALILYGIFYFFITNISNSISYKKIGKEIFSFENQIFFWIGCILFLIFISIEHHNTFALIMKIGMGILIVVDILFYLFSKFKEYPFGWAIWSIMLDVLAIPIGIIIILIALGAASYNSCWWWCDDN